MGVFKKIVLLVVILFIGLMAGYFYGSKDSPLGEETIEGKKAEECSTSVDDKVRLKLELLKRYTDFILFSPEQIGDTQKYADEMEAMVKSINDEQITFKFYATGETENKEQKIVDFLDFLNESVRSDLK